MSDGLNVYQKMLAVTKEVERVEKGDQMVNSQYRFVSHDAVMAALRPQFVEQGLVVLPTVTGWEQDGNRTVVDMQVSIINAEKPDDSVTIDVFGYGIDNQDKGPGKAISYALKYALLKAFSLETGDDPDNDAKTEHKPAKPWRGPRNKSSLKAEIQEAGRLLNGWDADEITAWLLTDEYYELSIQARHDLPDWWQGNGGDTHGLKGEIIRRAKELDVDPRDLPPIEPDERKEAA